MARNRENCITRSSSGKLGQLVFTSDDTIRSRPDTSKRVWSPRQLEQQQKMARAKEYGRMAISDPELNSFYAEKAAHKHGLGAWHLAISDYCHPPEILSANFPGFTGKQGDVVLIEVKDAYKVTEVAVSFADTCGLQECDLSQEVNFRYCWKYTLKSDIECVPGMSVTLQAKDLPGNITSKTLHWPFDCRETIRFTHAGKPASVKKREKSQLRPRRG